MNDVIDHAAGVDPAPEALPTGVQVNAVPCKIHTTFESTFIVDDVEAWSYVPQGIVAQGHWKGRTEQIDVLLSPQSVSWIELDFGRLRKFIDALPDAAE